MLDRALAAWPQAEFFQAYGLTETAGAVCINLPINHRSAEARASGKLNAVGGGQVDTVNLFKGCILRKDLQVEPASKARLATAEAVVWTGFMNESAAVSDVLRTAGSAGRKSGEPKWIDVSKGTVRTNQPTSTCFGSR